MSLRMVQIVLSSFTLGFTVSLWRMIGLLYFSLDLPPKPRRRVLRRTLRTVGLWQISIGGFLVSAGGWVNAVGLFLIGTIFLVSPNLMVGGVLTPKRGEEPDLSDMSDIERWLNEQ